MWTAITFIVGSITGLIIAGIIVLVGIIGFTDEIISRN